MDPAIQTIFDRLPDLPGHDATAPMLPRECYTSPEFFEFERSAVFSCSWICVGHQGQIPKTGDYLTPVVANEQLIVVRLEDGSIHAMSAVCRHRGQLIACEPGSGARNFTCPLHFWSYDLRGRFLGATRMGGPETLDKLRKTARLPSVRIELWHGLIFINLDADASPLAPSLAKLEPFWANYEDADLVVVPPKMSDTPLPWNWKIHYENFTDAYHPEFVHRGTHDFAPSVHPDGGVQFTNMTREDNAIVRSVPLLRPDGGMMEAGWGEPPAFPPIKTLAPEQRRRLTFAMVPPSLTLVFAPNAIAYQLIGASAVDKTFASNDRVTVGGWLVPRTTRELPDFDRRAATIQEGAKKIWAQDIPVNLGVQAGKHSRFMPDVQEDGFGPLEQTLLQFNAWLLRAYRKGADRVA
jgi:phenylpropionate dioxygenase-like ring-hydroxylating dioxygenase large terminal subunit